MKYDELTGQFKMAVEYGSAYILMLSEDGNVIAKVPMRLGERFTTSVAAAILGMEVVAFRLNDGSAADSVLVDEYVTVVTAVVDPDLVKCYAIYLDSLKVVIAEADRPYTKSEFYALCGFELDASDAVSINGVSATFPIVVQDSDIVALAMGGGGPTPTVGNITTRLCGAFGYRNTTSTYDNFARAVTTNPQPWVGVWNGDTLHCTIEPRLNTTDSIASMANAFDLRIPVSYGSSSANTYECQGIEILEDGQILEVSSFSGTLPIRGWETITVGSYKYYPTQENTLLSSQSSLLYEGHGVYSGVSPVGIVQSVTGLAADLATISNNFYDRLMAQMPYMLLLRQRSGAGAPPAGYYGIVGCVGSLASDPSPDFVVTVPGHSGE